MKANKITDAGEAAIQSARLVNYFMDQSRASSGGKETPDVVMIAALAMGFESLAKACITGVEVTSIVMLNKPVAPHALENLHTLVRRALMGALVTYRNDDPLDSLRKFHIIEDLVKGNKDALMEIAEETVATKMQDDLRDPLVTDWREGETKRLVGNTLVYRTYADKVMD